MHRWEWMLYLYFFNLGATWGWVIRATLRPLLPPERAPIPLAEDAGWVPGSVPGSFGTDVE